MGSPSIGVALPSVTVAVCTRNNPQTLLRDALHSLYANCTTRDDLEVWRETILVDQSTDTGTREATSKSAFATDPGATYVHMDARGLSRARNEAISRASSDVIAFIDDDIKVNPGHVRRISELFAQHADMVVMFGQVVVDLETYNVAAVQNWNATIPSFEVPADRMIRRPAALIDQCGIGANMAIRLETGRRHLFDPMLGAGARFASHEEADYVLRVAAAEPSASIGLFREPVVAHTGVRTGAAVGRLMRDNARGLAAVKVKHARMAGPARGLVPALLPIAGARKLMRSISTSGKPRGFRELPAYTWAACAALASGLDRDQGVFISAPRHAPF